MIFSEITHTHSIYMFCVCRIDWTPVVRFRFLLLTFFNWFCCQFFLLILFVVVVFVWFHFDSFQIFFSFHFSHLQFFSILSFVVVVVVGGRKLNTIEKNLNYKDFLWWKLLWYTAEFRFFSFSILKNSIVIIDDGCNQNFFKHTGRPFWFFIIIFYVLYKVYIEKEKEIF